MSSTLLKVASEHSSVVAVVGKGHLQGIKKHWKQPIEVNFFYPQNSLSIIDYNSYLWRILLEIYS